MEEDPVAKDPVELAPSSRCDRRPARAPLDGGDVWPPSLWNAVMRCGMHVPDAAEPMEEEVQPPHPREAARDRLREVCKKRGIELVG